MKNNIFLYLLGLIIIYCIFTCFMLTNVEGYQSTYYNESDEYSKTIDLPITFPFSCKNFCGPGNTCAITGEQCSNDYDCSGCEYSGSKNNLTPGSSLMTGDDWIKSFNKGIELYNRKELFNNPLDEFEKKIVPVYPKTTSITGQYYETTPPAYNINM